MDLTREFDGIPHRKSSRSGAGNDCVYPAHDLTAVADSKSRERLHVTRDGFAALIGHLRG